MKIPCAGPPGRGFKDARFEPMAYHDHQGIASNASMRSSGNLPSRYRFRRYFTFSYSASTLGLGSESNDSSAARVSSHWFR